MSASEERLAEIEEWDRTVTAATNLTLRAVPALWEAIDKLDERVARLEEFTIRPAAARGEQGGDDG